MTKGKEGIARVDAKVSQAVSDIEKLKGKTSPVSMEEVQAYLDYQRSHAFDDEQHKEILDKIGERVVSLKDVIHVSGALHQTRDHMFEQLITSYNIQVKVMKKLGATDEMVKEAQEEYKAEIAEYYNQVLETYQQEAPQATDENGEAVEVEVSEADTTKH